MKILHLESSVNWGGQELRILEEIEWLNAHGHSAWIGARRGSRILEEAGKRRIPSIEVNLRANFNPVSTLQLLAFIRKNGVQIVNTHSSKDAWHGVWLRCLGVPVVRTRHVVQAVKPGLFHRLVWTAGCRHLIATAETIRRQIVAATGMDERRASVVGEGIDLDRYSPRPAAVSLREEWGCTSGRTAALIGMFRSDKGHRHFVEAALELSAKFPDARFILVGGDIGSGALRRELEQKVLREGRTSQIRFLGYRADIAQIMASVDAIVIASTGTEAQSRIAPQAFALQRPVVATAVGGLPELVRDGITGLLVPPGDGRAIAEALERTWERTGETAKRVERARRLAVEELGLDRMMEKTLRVYRDVLGDGARD